MNKKNKKSPKDEEWQFYGSCATGGIFMVRKKDLKKIKTACEIHQEERLS